MKRKLTYKKRLTYVLIAGGIFLIVLYQMAISNTITLMHENSAMEEQISSYQNAPEQIKAIKIKLKKIEQLVGSETNENLDVHQLLLESITNYNQDNHLILTDFPQPYSISEKGYITNTAVVKVEGDFIPLLKLSNFIENNYQGGKIVALDFNVTREIRTRRRKLSSTIYLQNVKPEAHENNS